MTDYDFGVLHDKEFELLANDLLSKREGRTVDRFKAGKDGGVDGRFFELDGSEAIIQSKHWTKSGYSALLRNLKSIELPKIKKLDPPRYILATSVELSLANKKKIMSALSPYIRSEHDILGKENLNDLLSEHQDIEKKHYKLWLSSVNVLDIVMNAAISGRSRAKGIEIVENSPKYVMTSNHTLALEKLNETHSVIITGDAGIGKTTLADQLAHFFLANGFELCVFEDDISEAEAVFHDDIKKIFYFDDFLGRNYLMALEGRRDSRVLNFIERVRRDKSKRFILTSRSTVLKQAKSLSDLYDIKKIDEEEYEITIDSLSILDKARILYNLIWHGQLSEEYISQLYVDQRYLSIAQHRNYNPRLISFITDPRRLQDIPPERYWQYIEETLDNPSDIWEHVFDRQIDDVTRLAVCLVVFNGSYMWQSDFREAWLKQATNDGMIKSSNANSQYNGMVKSAIGSILSRYISCDSDEATITLFNPSVADFVLARYLADTTSLQTFFGCLDTVASLDNLLSLSDSEYLDRKQYLSMLKHLVSNKLHSDNLKEKTTYTLKLSEIALEEHKRLSSKELNLIAALARHLSSAATLGRQIEQARELFEFALSRDDSVPLRSELTKFVERAILTKLDHDNLLELYALAEQATWLNQDDSNDLLARIKDSMTTFWESKIDEMVAFESVLEDYFESRDSDKAFNDLYEYVTDKLSLMNYSEDEIASIVEHADIEEHIQNNRESRYEEELEFEYEGRDDRSEWKNELSQVHELFHRH